MNKNKIFHANMKEEDWSYEEDLQTKEK